jgi:hypothetical protein
LHPNVAKKDKTLTTNIDVHNCPIVLVVRSDSFTIIAVPKTDSTTLAGSEKKITVFIIFHASEWAVMPFEKNWTHSSAHVAGNNADYFLIFWADPESPETTGSPLSLSIYNKI